jgi:phage shock protein C
MICPHCEKETPEHSNYCCLCGARQLPSGRYRRLMRSAVDSKIAGVCGGLAEYLSVDPTLVRLAWAVLAVVPGGIVGGVLAYVLAWLIVPKAPTPASAPVAAKLDAARSS